MDKKNIDEVLYGYYKDSDKLKLSASGGICTALSELVIEKMNGVVFGAVYSKDFSRVEYGMATSVEQLSYFKGSKYISSKKEILVGGEYVPVYDYVIDYLKVGVNVLFTGLGCDVAALYMKCKKEGVDTANLFTIDLICHGTTLDKVHTDYISWLENKYRSGIKNFNVRYKKRGWVPPYIHVEFENGKEYEINFYKSDYGKAFAKIAKRGCYNCVFKGDNHKADITVGDYWGITEGMPEYNKNGVSIIFIHSETGYKLINKLDNEIFFFDKANKEFAISNNPMYLESRKKNPKYDRFCVDLKNRGLIFAVLNYEGLFKGLYWRLKDTINKD